MSVDNINFGNGHVEVSQHYENDRSLREQTIKYIIGEGEVRKVFYIGNDRNDRSATIRHNVTDTGIDIVTTPDGEKIITKLILRPQQVIDLYSAVKEEPPKWLLEISRLHMSRGYHEL